MSLGVGKRMMLCRYLAGLSREQASRGQAKLSASLIEDYEHEVEYPYPEQLGEMADAYDVTVDFLIGMRDYTPHAGRIVHV